jgi:hypothetical protein
MTADARMHTDLSKPDLAIDLMVSYLILGSYFLACCNECDEGR